MTITRDKIVEEARRLIGTPFKHQGRRPGIGLDCSGVPACIGTALKVPFDDEFDYPRQPDGASLKVSLDRWLRPVVAYQAGSILLHRIGKNPQHISVVSTRPHGGLGMIHACATAGKVVEHDLDERWIIRLVQAYDIPGVQ